jgi:hypothetical protein
LVQFGEREEDLGKVNKRENNKSKNRRIRNPKV